MVATMKKELIVLAPELKTSSEEVTKLMKVVVKQQGECDKVRAIVADDEAIAKVKTLYVSRCKTKINRKE